MVQTSWWIWFHVLVFAILAFDLGLFKSKKEISAEEKAINKKDLNLTKESIKWTLIWVGLALIFNIGVYNFISPEAASEFFTCYVLEKSLSVDNIFVMTIIFSHFKVEPKYQHRVLFWGILGALVMRIVFILGGVELISRFHFILYFFGAFLIFTGIKMFFSKDKDVHPEDNFVYKIAKKYLRMTPEFDGQKFFIVKDGKRFITPLFVVLLIIESTDFIFSLDSIPATLSVTKNAFVAYTSNIFAILGLRSLYFAFSGVVGLFRFLGQALSFILIFIGSKMLLEHYIVISTFTSLCVVFGAIGISVLCSVLIPEKKQ